jgi:hypothetical protein
MAEEVSIQRLRCQGDTTANPDELRGDMKMNTINMSGFGAKILLCKQRKSYPIIAQGSSSNPPPESFIRQLPKWLECSLAIAAEAGAYLAGSSPLALQRPASL